jgi:hypothetical protein
MENIKMKKYLAIIILTVFVLSIIGSVSPEIKSYVTKLTGNQKYASTLLPNPPAIKTIDNLAKK